MKKLNTFKAAEILLKYGIEYYNQYGITKRVHFQEVAKIEDIDEESMKNGLNHLYFIKLINVDAGGCYYINPEKLTLIIDKSQQGNLNQVIYINSEIKVSGEGKIIHDFMNLDRGFFIDTIDNNVPNELIDLWEKVKNTGLFNTIFSAFSSCTTN